jgi:hypothetical protein
VFEYGAFRSLTPHRSSLFLKPVLRRDKLDESAPPRFTPTGAIWPEAKKRTMAKVLAFKKSNTLFPLMEFGFVLPNSVMPAKSLAAFLKDSLFKRG